VRTIVLVACLALACDQGEKPAPAPKRESAKPTTIVTHGEITYSPLSGTPLDYLPKDSNLVANIDVTALRGTKMWPVARDLLRLLLSPDLADGEPPGEASNIVAGLVLSSGHATVVVRSPARDKPVVLHRVLPITNEALRDVIAERTGLRLKHIIANATVTERFNATVVITLGSLVEATNFATLVQSQRQSPQIKQLFDRFDLFANGAEVTFTVGMNETQLAAVLPTVRALLPSP
jgi:hypothetical protein